MELTVEEAKKHFSFIQKAKLNSMQFDAVADIWMAKM